MKKMILAMTIVAMLNGISLAMDTLNVEKKVESDFIETTIITREEFFAMLGETKGEELSDELDYTFEDEAEIEPQYKKYVYELVNEKVISGTLKDGKLYLQPKKEISKMEVAIVLTKFLGIYSTAPCEMRDENIPIWASEYISTAVNFGIMSLDENGYFNAKENLTKEEANIIIERLAERGYLTEKDVTVYSGSGTPSLSDGILSEASFFAPTGIVKNKSIIYVADTKNNALREIKNDEVSTVAGVTENRDEFNTVIGSFADGKNAKFDAPTFLAVPKSGLLITDTNNNLIRYFANGKVSTYAGNIVGGYKDGSRGKALFNNPTGIVATNRGIVYIADTGNNVIRKIDRYDSVSTYAGVVSEDGGYEDGNVKEARFNRPMGLALVGDVLYVADCGNQRIRKIEDGKVTTVAGGGDEYYDDSTEIIGDYIDGKIEDARFNFPQNIVVDKANNIYVADTGNSAIRKIDKNGNVYTILGLSEYDKVELVSPVGLMIDENKLYITDTVKNNIIVIDIEEVE